MKKVLLFILLILLMFLAITIDAQPQFFNVRIDNVGQAYAFTQSGAFAVPVDSVNPGPIHPGEAYSFAFDAAPGSRLSFATMFVQSNDLFAAPDEMGIPLFDSLGNPLIGDRTETLQLWDGGTEANEAPGEGNNQAPRQSGPNTGMEDSNNTVRLVDDGFDYPPILETLRFTLESEGGTSFTATIQNIATDSSLITSDGIPAPVVYAPGVYVVHSEPGPLFSTGEPDRAEGLEAIAEDGDPNQLADNLHLETGVTPVLAPGVFVVHSGENPLFTPGSADLGQGLEAIAEDGNPGHLAMVLRDSPDMTGGAFAIPVGLDMPGPVHPGAAYEFTIASGLTGRLSLATMYVQSNDLFYGPDGSGIPLFDSSGAPISGNITELFDLWDAGTEANEIPGIGINQAPRQSGLDTGMEDADNTVRLVNDGFDYPMDDQVIQVTITPIESIPFTVQIENVSDENTLPISDSESVPVPLAPGVWVVQTTSASLFTQSEKDRGFGLEAIAEDGDPGMLGDWFAGKMGTPSGVFATPLGSTDPAPLFPGDIYEFSFTAAPGAHLNLATMFVQSNDLFYAPNESGIPLFDENGTALMGDVTEWFDLWDSGTELNEQPGVGENQAPRQSGPDMGILDTDSLVRIVNDAFDYPEDEQVIKVTLSSGMSTAVTPLANELNLDLSIQSYPNPFLDQVTIRLKVDRPIEAGLDIFSLDGRRIAVLATPIQLRNGSYELIWNSPPQLSSGQYMLRIFNSEGILGSQMLIKK